jgi:3-oxoacyl-[acyl-carrier protein] reductase
MVDRAYDEFGEIDVLVNNAGTFSQVFLHELDVKEWDRVMGVNLRGCFLCTRMVLPRMLERGRGKVINVASQLGQIGGTEMVHYSASKAGVIGFTKALAREVSTKGIHVNAIAPGPILTDMMAEETDEWAAQKLSELPIGRFGEVHEVAPTAVFLASDESSYYVGQTLCPNGGDVML